GPRPQRCPHAVRGLLADALCRGLAHRAGGQQSARPDRSGEPRGRTRVPAAADDRGRALGSLAHPPAQRRLAVMTILMPRARLALVAAGLVALALAGGAAWWLAGNGAGT